MAARRATREGCAVTRIIALAFVVCLVGAAPAAAAGPPATGKTLSAALLGKSLQP
jgi:hypothetical protein